MQTEKKLFTPVKVGPFTLKHRVVLPPLSRLRAHWPSAEPSELMTEYYTQRASDGGLIMAEATAVSSPGRAYHTAPGLWNRAQVEAWRRITDAVHQKGGFMFVQLTHAGRATSSVLSGVQPGSASITPAYWDNKSVVVSTPDGFTLPSPHRSFVTDEIKAIVDEFRTAAENARSAGFDGIEILAGQAHLVEQFLHDSSNRRNDQFGGSFENRERFLLQIIDSVKEVWGSSQVGVRISPSSIFAGMGDSNPRALYQHLVQRLSYFNLAYLHVIEPRISGADTVSEGEEPVAAAELGKLFKGTVIAAGGFTPLTAEAAVITGLADLISFGRFFTSNPDLPYRIRNDLPLTPYDRSTFYAFDARGYTDWPFYKKEGI